MAKPLILVTNDDGIHAPGLALLASALGQVGAVRVYAPDRQQSAVGHGVSLHRPLRVTAVKDGWHMVDGTPTDCVMLAVRDLLGARPDVVVSGINAGANLGDDVTYSGTVAGAYEGMLLGIPSIAISDVHFACKHMDSAATFAVKITKFIFEHGLPRDTMLNINVPDLPYSQIRGAQITRMGRRDYQDEIVRREDPRGTSYYWIGGSEPSHVREAGTDFEAIESDCISITPLHRDVTNYEALEILRRKTLPFQGNGINANE
ncbi:MAG: 5'/3'-nucleotidase SurE [Candidatus Hydrogenedentes bacterium]|nr:5'/3'-nucleotidase SurE [Candidatus Hydrogenedentota bacterium]